MKKVKTAAVIGIILIIVLGVAAAIVYLSYRSGFIHFVNPKESDYPVRGLSISSEQGAVDYLYFFENHALDFAFVRATKGVSTKDTEYTTNWVTLRQYGVVTAASHSFTFGEDGTAQADNFIRTVPVQPGNLPPVVSIFLDGKNSGNPPDKDEVEPELSKLLKALEDKYGVKPILFCNARTYGLYLSEGYGDYLLSIANDVSIPNPEGREWTFWQYTDNTSLITGKGEKTTAMNLLVYQGGKEAFESAFEVKLPRKPNLKAGTTVSSVASKAG